MKERHATTVGCDTHFTPTAAIAREVGTSESQLVRHYRAKSRLLAAIFNKSWQPPNQHIRMVVVGVTDAREALVAVLETVREAGRQAC